jgi:cell division septation protein DedD
MDLSFYKALGGGRAQTPREPALSPAPRDEAAAAPAGAYVVQALATRDGAAARRLRSRLAARGLPATLLESRDAQGPIFRVRVGRYRDRAGAEAVARRARAIPGLDPWVLRESE